MANRGRRGGRSEMSVDGGEVDQIEAPEDSIIVVDDEGNPIDDDMTGGVDVVVQTDDDPEPATEDDDPVGVLKRELDAATAARDAATARAAEAERRASASQEDQTATTAALLDHALHNAKAELAAAKEKFKAAMKAGNHDAAADAQEEIAIRAQELSQFTTAIEEFKTQAKDPKQRQQPAAERPHVEKVEAYIATLTPKQQEFARKHRDKIFPDGDPKPLQKVYALSNVAALEHGTDTPEFFAYIEKQMGLDVADQKTKTQQPAPRRKAPPIAGAPVARGQVPGGGNNTVQLTREQVDMAKRMGMTPKRYALHLKTAMEGGQDPNYRGPRLSRDDPSLSGRR